MKSAKRPERFILVVDDADHNRERFVQLLVHTGCRVETAADGFEAIAKSVSLCPDVIVMDLGLPKLDGWEAIRKIKAHPVTKRSPSLP